jgi:hypothetical protein
MLNSISRDLTLGMHIEEDRVKMEREREKKGKCRTHLLSLPETAKFIRRR